MSLPEKIESDAALWVVRLERGLTGTEQDEFLEWLTSDPRHGDELSRQKSGWTRLDLLADWRPEHSRHPNRDLLAPASSRLVTRLKENAVLYFSVSLATAAVIAIGVFFLRARAPEPRPAAPARIALIEERRLEDGSLVALNRGAEIRVNFSAKLRSVELSRGEAHFQVAKNPDRPFVVTAHGVQVRAVGTAFDVRLKSAAVEVVVTEGKVRVESPESPGSKPNESFVEAGQRTVVSLAPATPASVASVTPTEVDALLAWQPRLLDFTDASLRSIVAEFNRRNAPIQLVIADPALADTVLNASLRSDNIEGFLRLLDGGFGIKAERSGNVVVLRRATQP